MDITIRLFAGARDTAGTSSTVIQLPHGGTAKLALDQLLLHFPALTRLVAVSRVAVNLDYASLDTVLQPGDELAVLPPVSGGGI